MSRQRTMRTTQLEAECLRCAWRTTAANGLGNAAKHHDATGHPVRTVIEREIIYGDPAAPMDGQEEMFPQPVRSVLH